MDLHSSSRVAIATEFNDAPMRFSCLWINTSPPNAAYMRQWIESALVQIMACRLFGTKPLSKSIGPSGTNLSEFVLLKYKNFHIRKCISTYRLRTGCHFVQGGEELMQRGCSTLAVAKQLRLFWRKPSICFYHLCYLKFYWTIYYTMWFRYITVNMLLITSNDQPIAFTHDSEVRDIFCD